MMQFNFIFLFFLLCIFGIANAQEQNCSDGIDNDNDGLVDYLDPDCQYIQVDMPTINCQPCDTPGCNITASSNSIFRNGTASWSMSGANIINSSWVISPTTGVVGATAGTGLTTGIKTFNTAGNYTVTYTANNPNVTPYGCDPPGIATCTDVISVLIPPCSTPGCGISGSVYPTIVSSGSSGSFSISGSNINSATWSASTGASGSGTSFSTSFASPGSYTVSANTVNNSSPSSCSPTGTNSCSATVVACCQTTNTISGGGTTSINQGQYAGVSSTSTGCSVTTSWSISPTTGVVGATSGSGTNTPSWQFTSAGSFTVTITATTSANPGSCPSSYTTDISTHVINVAPDPCYPCTGTACPLSNVYSSLVVSGPTSVPVGSTQTYTISYTKNPATCGCTTGDRVALNRATATDINFPGMGPHCASPGIDCASISGCSGSATVQVTFTGAAAGISSEISPFVSSGSSSCQWCGDHTLGNRLEVTLIP